MIGIVGAGITGLSLSLLLEERGVDHRVLEASTRPGGVLRSERVHGRVLDFGPQRTRATEPVRRMIDRLDLGDRTVEVPPDHPLYILRGGRLRRVPFGLADLFRTDLLSPRGKLRVLREPWTAGYGPDETVGGFLTRKFGGEAYENLLAPLFGGLYGSDPGDMLVRHSLAATLKGFGIERSILRAFVKGSFDRSASPAALSFVDGMQEFTDAMHRAMADRVELGNGVRRLIPADAVDGRAGWVAIDSSGNERHFSAVVLTVPANEAAELLRSAAADAAGRLGSLRYNRLALVHMEGDCDLHGLGYQVAYGEPARTRGVTWNASALGRDGVYTAFLGGARDPGLPELDDRAIGDIATREFQEATGCEARVLRVSRTRVPSWDRSWAALEGLELPAGIHLCSNYESRIGIPGRLQRAEALADQLSI